MVQPRPPCLGMARSWSRATVTEAIALSQRIAPEHVVCDDDAVAAKLTKAGTVFVGDYSAQALGDYSTGSNHGCPPAVRHVDVAA